MMNLEYVIEGKDIEKSFKGFKLQIEELRIPKGLATALIGENGAGKSTLMNVLAGIRLDHKGSIRYFNAFDNQERDTENHKERIGYTGPGHFYLPNWNMKQVEEVSDLIFNNFHKDRFEELCQDMAVFGEGKFDASKKISTFSDGTKMKVMLANILARDTELLILDEPASPLDPLMRDKLCEMLQEYIEEGNGERSVFFSTHNVSDMEHVTDYAIIMEHGKIVEEGLVEELKEKYILVKGDAEDSAKAKEVLYTITTNNYGFEGICLAENLDKLAGLNVTRETPSLYQISVAVMKANSLMKR